MKPYPFAHLDALREEREARGMDMIDLSIGDLKEPTPEPVKAALRAAVPDRSSYPRAVGLPEYRRAVAGWMARRFGVSVHPEREVLPTNGSKEAVFSIHLAVVDPKERPLVLVPDPAYPVYELGVAASGGEVVPTPLRSERRYLPDLAAIPGSVWKRTAILWINYPNNPTGATAPPEFFAEAAARCREHGVLLCSDEPYTEIYFGEPPVSALACGMENVVAFHTLSKRSAMPGYRAGFLAGDARLIDALKKFRPGLGTATPQFIQEAARVAWEDETHVTQIRSRFRERRDVTVSGLRALGCAVEEAAATIYVWARIPGGGDSESFVLRCLDEGVVLLPGSAMGREGEGYFRLSLVAPPDRLEEAVRRIGRAMAKLAAPGSAS